MYLKDFLFMYVDKLCFDYSYVEYNLIAGFVAKSHNPFVTSIISLTAFQTISE